ncbi:hypothetical protein FALBO_17078, partial [Fusarium albosuccineum]
EGNAPQTRSRVAAARAELVAAADAANAALEADLVQRQVPCLACLNSALAGQSTGVCMAKPGARRYESEEHCPRYNTISISGSTHPPSFVLMPCAIPI